MARITVLVPVLNGMPFITEMFASLEAQTFRDFDIMLWDNGSVDGTIAEAKRWIPSRIPGRVVTNTPLPLHQCLARMVQECPSDLCARMDADDICLPSRLASQVTFLEENKNVAAVGGQMELIDTHGQFLGKAPVYPCESEVIDFAFLKSNPMAHNTIVYRRSDILDSGNYRKEKPIEDYDLWMRLAQRKRLANLPAVTVRYRIHAGATTGTLNATSASIELAIMGVVSDNALHSFGLTSKVCCMLRQKKYPCSMFPLLGVLRRIAGRRKVPLRLVLGNPLVIFIARCLTGPQDVASRLLWRALENGIGAKPDARIAGHPLSW